MPAKSREAFKTEKGKSFFWLLPSFAKQSPTG
jgi:hypothetical protein